MRLYLVIIASFMLLFVHPLYAQSDNNTPIILTEHDSNDIYSYDLQSGRLRRICTPPDGSSIDREYNTTISYSSVNVVQDIVRQRIAFAVRSDSSDPYRPNSGTDVPSTPSDSPIRIVTCSGYNFNTRYVGAIEDNVIEFSPQFSPNGNQLAFIRGRVTDELNWENVVVIYDFEAQTETTISIDLVDGLLGTAMTMTWGEAGIAIYYSLENQFIYFDSTGTLLAHHQLQSNRNLDFFEDGQPISGAFAQFIPRDAITPIEWVQINDAPYVLLGILPATVGPPNYDYYLYDVAQDEIVVGSGNLTIGYPSLGDDGLQVERSSERYRYCEVYLPYYEDNFALSPDGRSFIGITFEYYPFGGTAYVVDIDGIPDCSGFPQQNFYATALDTPSAGFGGNGAHHAYWGNNPYYINRWTMRAVLPTENLID